MEGSAVKILLKRSSVVSAFLAFAAFAVAQQDLPNAPVPSASAQTSTAPKTTTGDFDGPVYQVGGSVLPPIATYTPDPEFSESMRKKKTSVNVVVGLIVDANGNLRDVHVLRGAGAGYDEKAVEAVQRYKFKPAMKNNVPVAVYLNVEVNYPSF